MCMIELTWKPIEVDTGSPHEQEGLLGLVNGKLVAVLVHFSSTHEDPELRDVWFLEAGFGPLLGKHEVFPTFEEAEAWARRHFEPVESRGPGRMSLVAPQVSPFAAGLALIAVLGLNAPFAA